MPALGKNADKEQRRTLILAYLDSDKNRRLGEVMQKHFEDTYGEPVRPTAPPAEGDGGNNDGNPTS